MSTFPQSHPHVKKRIAGILAATTLVAAVGSFALFTDRAQSQATLEAGTLDLTLVESWAANNANVIDEYAPGDILNLDYTLTNDGSLSTDIREQFVITSDKADTVGSFAIYAASEVEADAASGMYAVKDGVDPVAVPGAVKQYQKDGKTYYAMVYSIDELTVDGSKETGDATASKAGSTIAANVKTGDYVLLFDEDAPNAVQGANLTVEYMAQGLQHRNTGDDTWSDAKVITKEISIGGVATKVVPTVAEHN